MPSKIESEWSRGELELQRKLKVPPMENPTAVGLPQRHYGRVMRSPLMALGTLDGEGRPWTTVWGGERTFVRPIAEDVLGVNSGVSRLDPVFELLWGDKGESGSGAVVQMNNKLMSGLVIDLETRDRVKMMGAAVAGAMVGEERVQLAMHVAGSLGNCPKYLNKKAVVPHDTAGAERVWGEGDGLRLGAEALGLLDEADLFFMSTTDEESMDTNHRGGKPGFVRVLRNDDDVVELIYPECKFLKSFPVSFLSTVHSHQSPEHWNIKLTAGTS